MKKRLLSILLCLVMMLSLLPTVAFAEATVIPEVRITVTGADTSSNSVTAGALPKFTATTDSEYVSIDVANTRWLKRSGSVPRGFGSGDEIALKDGTTEYLMRFSINYKSAYKDTHKLTSATEIYINGERRYGALENQYSWGAYFTLNLGKASGTDPEYYTVTYDTHGGSNINPIQILAPGRVIGSSTPSRDGYTFDGWYADEAYTTPFNFDRPITSDTTLHAKWTSNITTPVTGVTLNTSSFFLKAGESESLTATVAPANASDKTVIWTSDKPSVATVDNTGKVTAVSTGEAVITATTQDGEKKATCFARVYSGYNVWVGDTEITPSNKGNVLGDGKVSYDPDTCTLTLNNLTAVTGYHRVGNVCPRIFSGSSDLKLNLVGSNVLPDPSTGYYNCGVWVYGSSYKLTIGGTGSLKIDCANSQSIGIYAANLVIDGGEVYAKAGTGVDTYHLWLNGGTLEAVSTFSIRALSYITSSGALHLADGVKIYKVTGEEKTEITASSLASNSYSHVILVAAPVTTYPVWVSNVQVTSANKGNVLGDGNVSYDPESKTLTVAEGANITGNHDGAMIYTTDTGKLTINGNLTLSGGSDVLYGVYSGFGNIEITGNADITVAKTNAAAIYANEITVDGSAKLTAAGDCLYALHAKTGNITVGGDVEIKTSGEGSFTKGLETFSSGHVTVGGSVTATTKDKAIFAQDASGVTVKGDVTITVTDSGKIAIDAYSGPVSIGGKATITGTGGDTAIRALDKNIQVNKDLTVRGFNYGLNTGSGTVTMPSGATWDIDAASVAIQGKDININDNEITLPVGGVIGGASGRKTVKDGAMDAKHVVIKAKEITYPVWVSGTQVTSANKDNVLGDGKVSYDPEINILMVAGGASITGTHEHALIYAENMDLTVNGDVTLTAAAEKGIYVRGGSLTVNGSYTAEAAYPGNIAAWATGSITVTGDVIVKNYGYGLEADSGKITVGGHVTAEAFAVALCTEDGDISVGEAVDITLVEDGNGDTFGIRANGAVEITGGAAITGNNGRVAVNAKAIELGGDAEISGFAIGLYASDGDIAVKGDADITVNSTNKDAITAQNGNVTIDGNATIGGSGDCAIYANEDLTVGKDVTVTGSFNHGLRASNGKVTMKSGEWDITAQYDAIEAKTAIVIPDTHSITTPEGGKVGADATNPGYVAVSESDGTTVAKHAVIEPKAVTAKITLTKSFVGIDDNDRPINTATFTVTSSDGTVYDSAAVGDRAFAGTPAAGQFVWKLEDVPAGTYTITETAYDVDGYSCTVTYKVGTGNEQEGDAATATLAAGDDLVIAFVDTYTKDVTVTFDATGGTCDTATMTTGADGKLAELPTATPDGTDGVFHGWFTDRQNGDMITTDTVFEEDTTVYALFSYPITVVGGTGSVGDIDTDMIATCPAGMTVTLRVDEEQIPEGKVFDKWVVTEGSFTVTDPENADGATFTSVTEKMVVTATYKDARPDRPDWPNWPFHPGRPTTPTRPAAPTDITTPKTGDSSNMMLWTMLVVMSGAALCGAAVVSRKRKHN